MNADLAIAAVARRQHGVFSRAEALRLGFTRDMIRRRLASGAWIRLAAGVYALAGSALTTRRQYKAAELSAAGAAVSGLAAAHLHGLPGFVVVRPEIVVPSPRSSRNALATVHRSLIPPRLTTVRGIRTTSVAQTLLDISARVPELRLERAMDDSLLTKKARMADLEERSEAYASTRRRGWRLYADLVSERRVEGYEPPESELEATLLRFVDRVPRLGRAVVQAPVSWRTRRPGRVDVLLTDVDAIVEGDSRRWHARVQDFDDDRERDNEAVLHGLVTLRFTWRHLTSREAMVLDQLERLADRRAV